MTNAQEWQTNRLLSGLPDEVLQRWQPHFEVVDLAVGESLYESGDTLRHVYFPTTAIVSLQYTTRDGGSAEIAVAGNDGMVGIALVMGGGSTPSAAVVQNAGRSIRLAAAQLRAELQRGGAAMRLLLRYAQALTTQMAQTAVCNRHHSLDQRMCRRLLSGLDRVKGDDIVLTHQAMADMLGVRREGVSEASMGLHRAGLIDHHRGHITVVNRRALEARSCECYAVVKKEYDRLLVPEMAA